MYQCYWWLCVAAVRDDQERIAVDRGDEAVEKSRDLTGMRRTDDERETHRCMVVGPVSRPRLRAGRETRSERETEAGAPALRVARLGERLRLAAAPRDRCAGHSTGTRVTEIRLLCTSASIIERHTKNGAFSFSDLRAARVANEDGLSSHDSPSAVEITFAISTSRAF